MIEKTNGSRAEVWHGTAKKTVGGLTKSDLLMNKHGRIVSRKKHNTAKREKRLVKAGYLTKKGHFGFIKKGSKKGSKKRGGGAPNGMPTRTQHVGTQNEGKGMMMKGGNAMTMHKGMMSKSMGHTMKGGNGMMMPKGMMKGGNAMMMGMMKKGGRHTMKMMKGGMHALSPSSYDGQGVGTSGANLQIMATQMN